MTCYYQRTAYPIEGGITFERPSGHSGNHIKIPCKRCVGCRLDHRTDWATRMMHEASFYDNSHFLTLTYDEENLPSDGNLQPEHLQKFLKRLRFRFRQKLRFVACGEYGEKRSRPHYHAIVFGLDLPDLKAESRNDRGELLYGSKILDGIWGHGKTKTGDVTYQSCGYVAGYMLKDIRGDYSDDGEYRALDLATGEYIPRLRPFARYSNRPGIGRDWIEKFYKDVFPQDCIHTSEGGTRPVPDYYFRMLAALDPDLYLQVKEKRETAIWTPHNRWNSTPERLKVRETVKLAKINLAKRGSTKSKENKIFVQEGSV